MDLQLEQLEHAGPLDGPGHQPKLPPLVRQHQSRSIGTQQLDRPLGEHLEQVDHVELLDQGVRQLDKDLRQTPGIIHELLLCSCHYL